MIDRGREFVQWIQELMERSEEEWRQCPHCGSKETCKNGTYLRHPQTLNGVKEVRIQRHLCRDCGKSYHEERPDLVPGSWYGRDVHRLAVDHWVHTRSSLRRTAELMRSWIGHQERWWQWCPWERLFPEKRERREPCFLVASTVHRWTAKAGQKASEDISGQWEGIENSGQFGADGLWALLRDGAQRVVLMLSDVATGMVMATRAVDGEGKAANWGQLFERAREAGLSWKDIDGLVSDATNGLYSFVNDKMGRVHHALCHWHEWRILSRDVSKVVSEMTKEAQRQARKELGQLLHAILDASSFEAAEAGLQALKAHPYGKKLAQKVNRHFDRLLYHLLPDHQDLVRVSPEWVWRDFRLRLSHGRNHGSETRLEEAAQLWMVYHNFTPAQYRSERRRTYKHPGLSPLEVAGAPTEEISYLDALEV